MDIYEEYKRNYAIYRADMDEMNARLSMLQTRLWNYQRLLRDNPPLDSRERKNLKDYIRKLSRRVANLEEWVSAKMRIFSNYVDTVIDYYAVNAA